MSDKRKKSWLARDVIPYGVYLLLEMIFPEFYHDSTVEFVTGTDIVITHKADDQLVYERIYLELNEYSDNFGSRRIQCAYCEQNDTLYIYKRKGKKWVG